MSEVNNPMVARLKKVELISTLHKSNKKAVREEVEKTMAENMHQLFADKGILPNIVNRVARDGNMGNFFTSLVLRSNPALQTKSINTALIKNPMSFEPRASLYSGSEEENEVIDRAIQSGSNISLDDRRFHSGSAASRTFLTNGETIVFNGNQIYNTPVIIIGAGAAGTLIAKGLNYVGFSLNSIRIIDKTGSFGGLWNQKNVFDGTINSPFEFNFEGTRLTPAPGAGTKARDFIQTISFGLNPPIKGTVTGVVPGDLNHIVKYNNGQEDRILSAPIVINAIGIGTPLNPNHNGHMRTTTPTEAGIRWQQQITSSDIASRYRNKMVILIGLGNSTAEMLTQIHKLNNEGNNIDFRVITHYPAEAIRNPANDIHLYGVKYRVYRDLEEPNLTKYEGDLVEPREAYEYAVRNDKIISDITFWRSKNFKIFMKTRYGQNISLKYDYLYTLIGYGHDPVEMENMGMLVTDNYRGSVATDYDGEVQRRIPSTFWKTGRDRIYPGYFALGAVSATNRNKNAMVIPGIMHKMYDMIFTILLRSQEYQLNTLK